MASDDLDTLARLRGLLDVSRVVRDDESLPDVLSAIARTISESLGYQAVVVNLYRPAWDDFEVTTVHDRDPRSVEQLLGSRGTWTDWEPLLHERFKRRAFHAIGQRSGFCAGAFLDLLNQIVRAQASPQNIQRVPHGAENALGSFT